MLSLALLLVLSQVQPLFYTVQTPYPVLLTSVIVYFFYQRVYEEDVSKDETNEEKEKAPEPEKVSCIILNVIALRGFIPCTPQH